MVVSFTGILINLLLKEISSILTLETPMVWHVPKIILISLFVLEEQQIIIPGKTLAIQKMEAEPGILPTPFLIPNPGLGTLLFLPPERPGFGHRIKSAADTGHFRSPVHCLCFLLQIKVHHGLNAKG